MDFETRAIHTGQEPDPATGAIITPIYQTATLPRAARHSSISPIFRWPHQR